MPIRISFTFKYIWEEEEVCVGPIWGQYEAETKVNRWLDENKKTEEGWRFTGEWWSGVLTIIHFNELFSSAWNVICQHSPKSKSVSKY